MAVFTAAMNAFLSNVPACCASIVSTFAAFAWPATSSVGASAASCASFAFDAAGGCAFLAVGESLDVALHLGERRVLARASRPAAARAAGAACRRVSGAGAGRRHRRRHRGHRRAGRRRGPVPVRRPWGLRGGGLAERRDRLDGLGGGTGFFGATAPGPKPVVVTASAEAGGLLASPSRSTWTPAALACLQPLLDELDVGLVAPRTSAQGAVDVDPRRVAGPFELRRRAGHSPRSCPAARCSASSAPRRCAGRRRAAPGTLPPLGERARSSPPGWHRLRAGQRWRDRPSPVARWSSSSVRPLPAPRPGAAPRRLAARAGLLPLPPPRPRAGRRSMRLHGLVCPSRLAACAAAPARRLAHHLVGVVGRLELEPVGGVADADTAAAAACRRPGRCAAARRG